MNHEGRTGKGGRNKEGRVGSFLTGGGTKETWGFKQREKREKAHFARDTIGVIIS